MPTLERQVDHHQVGAVPLDFPHRFRDVGRFAADLDIGLAAQQVGQTATHQGMIVDQKDLVSAMHKARAFFRSRHGDPLPP